MRIISVNGMVNLNFSECAVFIGPRRSDGTYFEIGAMNQDRYYRLGRYKGLTDAIYEMQNIEISYESGLKVYQLRGDYL